MDPPNNKMTTSDASKRSIISKVARKKGFLAKKITTKSRKSNIFSDQEDERKFPGCNLTIFPIFNVSIMNS